MSDLISLSGVYAKLRTACEVAGSQSAFAEKHGMSASYVSDVANARKDPGPKILAALELVEVKRFMVIQKKEDKTNG